MFNVRVSHGKEKDGQEFTFVKYEDESGHKMASKLLGWLSVTTARFRIMRFRDEAKRVKY